MAVNPKKGDIVSFQLVRNGLIGDPKIQVLVEGDINYSIAKAIDPEINRKHETLFPYFSSAVGGNNDPSSYPYIGIINTNGQLEVIGVPWILESSFQYVQSRRATINVSNWREEFTAPVTSFFADLGVNWTIAKFED